MGDDIRFNVVIQKIIECNIDAQANARVFMFLSQQQTNNRCYYVDALYALRDRDETFRYANST